MTGSQLLNAPSALPAPAVEEGAPQRLRVGFILLDQFTIAAFSGLIDALRLAADHGARGRQVHAAWTVMTLGGGPRRSSCGVAVTPNGDLVDPPAFDYLAVCGGNDYLNENPPEALLDYLRRAGRAGVRMLGICTGTFLLAKAGLVGGRRVCVHWNVLDAFNAQFPGIKAGGGPAVHRRGRPYHLRRLHRRHRSGALSGGPPLRARQGPAGHAPHDGAGHAPGRHAASPLLCQPRTYPRRAGAPGRPLHRAAAG